MPAKTITPMKQEGVDPGVNDNEALQTACKDHHTSVLRHLLTDKRVDASARSNEAIQIASAKGFADIVALLLKDPRVDPGR